MDELVNLVVQKTGISQDDARKAVEVIVNTLKSKLPGPIAGHLDSFLSGGASGGMV
jgi:nucleoid DNA-binding protein